MKQGKDLVNSDPSLVAGNHRNRRPIRAIAAVAALTLAACSSPAKVNASANKATTTQTVPSPEQVRRNVDEKLKTDVPQLAQRVIDMYEVKSDAKKVALADEQGYETINMNYDVPTSMLGDGFVGRYSFSLTARRDAHGNLDPKSAKELAFSKDYVDPKDANKSWPISGLRFTKVRNSADWLIDLRERSGQTSLVPLKFNTESPNGLIDWYGTKGSSLIDELNDTFAEVINQAKAKDPMPPVSRWEA